MSVFFIESDRIVASRLYDVMINQREVFESYQSHWLNKDEKWLSELQYTYIGNLLTEIKSRPHINKEYFLSVARLNGYQGN